MNKLESLWADLRASLWFLPTIIVTVAVGLAVAMVQLEGVFDGREWSGWAARVFGAAADGSRGVLTAIATSMATVAGVVFSITIVALSLTSSQYSSRVLRNFMTNRPNQVVLGVFLGIFAYCLTVLRTIRGGSDEFVPSIAVLVGVLLAFLGLGTLIYFIHHIATLIQASTILAEVRGDTIRAVDALFPEPLGEGEDDRLDGGPDHRDLRWFAVPARRTGYIQRVDVDGMTRFARDHGTVVHMDHGIGDFVTEASALASVSSPAAAGQRSVDALNGVYTIANQRSIEQDAEYGIRQLVDVAVKALSPGINDPTTAVMCVDQLTAILTRVIDRRIEPAHRYESGELRVIARGPDFADLLSEAFDDIRRHAEGNVAVLARLLQALSSLGERARAPHRRRALRQQTEAMAEVIRRTVAAPRDQAALDARAALLLRSLDGVPEAIGIHR